MSEAIDMIRAGCSNPADVVVRHVVEGDFETGKQPKPDPGTFEISGASYCLLMADLAGRGKGKLK